MLIKIRFFEKKLCCGDINQKIIEKKFKLMIKINNVVLKINKLLIEWYHDINKIMM